MSYTTFEYSGLEISAFEDGDYPVRVSVQVTNTGERDGDEIVQLYIRDVLSSVTTYEKRLAGFERVSLRAGESKRVEFALRRDAFELIDRDWNRVIEPGDFRIMVGASSEDIRLEGVVSV